MKIVKLTASNIKRLKAVEITPKGDMVVLSGKNGEGKSSILDAIQMALGGVSEHCKEPVRRGTTKAYTVCDLGDLKVTRTFTANGNTSLVVESDGKKMASPQSILDGLVGKLTFDPLRFSRLTPKQQADELREMVGVDVSKIDADRDRLFAQRAEVNRSLKQAEANLSTQARHTDAPAQEIASSILIERMNAAIEANQEVESRRAESDRLTKKSLSIQEQIESLQKQADECGELILKLKTALRGSQIIDVAAIQSELNNLEGANRKVRANAEYDRLAAKVSALKSDSLALTGKISDCEESKLAALTSVKFPIDGLSLSPVGDVLFNGLPLEQSSHGEMLRVSTAIGLAANPKLKVLLIRDASLLDTDGMKMLGEMAAKADAQLWVERVEGDQPGAVVIEDGAVKEGDSE